MPEPPLRETVRSGNFSYPLEKSGPCTNPMRYSDTTAKCAGKASFRMGIRQKLQHISLAPATWSVEYLKTFFDFFARRGGTGILLDYKTSFPYSGPLKDLRAENAYTEKEIAELCAHAEKLGLALFPKGVSFSHAEAILRCPQFAFLADGNGLNLARPESVDLLAESSRQLAALHPGCRMIHLGGDEIFPFALAPESHAAALRRGKGGLYADFLNRFAERTRKLSVSFGIWSDMLIRYPEAVDRLNHDYTIFYWDYWSFGDRCPLLSIGGGCPDLMVLEREALPRDLGKILRNSAVREGGEIPCGLAERYASCWELSADRRRARSFPYIRFFREHGFPVISSGLVYPEKGSILSNFSEKLEHIRWFAKRSMEDGADGMMSCYWAPFWPDLKLMEPAVGIYLALSEHPELTDQALLEWCTPEGWSTKAFELYLRTANDFEFNDLLSVEWTPSDYRKQLDWIRRAGLADDEIRRCRESLELGSAFLAEHPGHDCFRETVEELLFRAELERNALENRSPSADAMRELERFEKRLRHRNLFFARPVDSPFRETLRFGALRDFLNSSGEENEGKK